MVHVQLDLDKRISRIWRLLCSVRDRVAVAGPYGITVVSLNIFLHVEQQNVIPLKKT